MMRAVYAGSFDPFTKGHEDIVVLASEAYELTVLFAINPQKNRYTDLDSMYVKVATYLRNKYSIETEICRGYVADYCKEHRITRLVRGVRNMMDWAYEEEIAKINAEIWSPLKTVYYRAENDIISSTLVRDFHRNGRDISKYVPEGIEF